MEVNLPFAKRLDQDDVLKEFRNEFFIPKTSDGKDYIYLAGNSLGLQPKKVKEFVNEELDDWAKLGVEGHLYARHPWLPYHESVTESMARLVGAKPFEVVVMNTLTVNLHLMMVTFYRPTAKKYKIVIEGGAFPSDQYAVKSQIKFHGFDPKTALIELMPRPGEACLRTEDIVSTIDSQSESIALVLLGGVNYLTGQAYDFHEIARSAKKNHCEMGLDLAHGVGNLVLNLHDWNVDFAVWCTYKYLNAGPGGLSGSFIHERHSKNFELPRFAGWWGHNKSTRFQMGSEFDPLHGAEGWQLSNPPILQLAALRASLEIFDRAEMNCLRAKSEKLTGYLEFLIKSLDTDFYSIVTPSTPSQRGCQISLKTGKKKSHIGSKEFVSKMARHGIICDYREPGFIRLAPVPLYNTFTDVYIMANILDQL